MSGGEPGEMTLMLGAALLWDRAFGEPPAVVHPVVWMGRLIKAVERRLRRGSPADELLQGAALAVVLPLAWALGAWLVLRGLADLPWVRLVVGTWLLKSTFAVRALGEAARTVEDALLAGDLGGARRHLGSLCSRDASTLDEGQVAAGAIESVAENTSDSVVAPLFFFVLFGLPGAVAYRAINTADAMVGYHGRYEYLGKVAARLDDLANWIPARVSAGLLLLSGALQGLAAGRALAVLRRDGAATESPNAGRPMAVMAGLLGVRLEKPGHYTLGDARETVQAWHLRRAWRVALGASYGAFLLAALWVWQG